MRRIEDPITGQVNYIGTQVNRAARIEPMTPPDTIYATEAFAACLALEPSIGYQMEYVGTLEAHKDEAQFRILSLFRGPKNLGNLADA